MIVSNYGFTLFIVLPLTSIIIVTGDEDVTIKIKTMKDLEDWRLLQMQAKQDYYFRKRVMDHSVVCRERISCEESFMSTDEKYRLLKVLNKQRDYWSQRSCEKTSTMQLIWLWKAEINATVDALRCQNGSHKTDVIMDGDLDVTKYYQKSDGFAVYPGEAFSWNSREETNKFPIRERLSCFPYSKKFILNSTSFDEFLKLFRKQFCCKFNVKKCISEQIPFKDCIYVGCSLAYATTETSNQTNAYFNCYFCNRTITNLSSTHNLSSDCPLSMKKSNEHNNLCQDTDIKNTFISDLITRQYDCQTLLVSAGYSHCKINALVIVWVLFLKIYAI